MAEANQQLQADIAKDPRRWDIENVGESEGQYIEMDLGLGVFDMKPKADDRAPEDIHIPTRADMADDCASEDGDSSVRIVLDPSSIASRHRTIKPQIEMLSSKALPETCDSDDDDSDKSDASMG
ncbi:hypothetical protein H4R26_004029 [Coemansia thaxteri]|uniref:Uncharacterized protein n=1 Tax=Coemansia thaxteri TaxID=2663907 RepID=A0A9W8EIL1_9FUNG|nr:hypothetical protein H4R26_004029 [Coemansia thaxteri]KAJ2478222.1 hypothetical protein EV174_004381 [Coemansia sp. RSA 2320]